MKIRFIMIFGLENSRSHHWTRDLYWEFACSITASYKRRGIQEFTFLQKPVNAEFIKFMNHDHLVPFFLVTVLKYSKQSKFMGRRHQQAWKIQIIQWKKWKFFDYKMSNILFCLSYLKSDLLDCTLRHFGCLRTSPRSLIFFQLQFGPLGPKKVTERGLC